MESHSGGLSYTSVVVLTLESGEVYIVITLSTQPNAQVIYIDPCTGSLSHKGKWGDDVFKSEQEAIDHVINRSSRRRYSAVFARAVLGYAALGSCGLLLVATKVGPSISDLPGGGRVYTVVESQWIRVGLENAQPIGRGERKNVNELMELDIDGKYYFCETRDITRPFPSRMKVEKADEEFVWNGWLASHFKSIGLPRHCVTLLQGFAECREFGSSGQQEGIVALIARRSRLHPGTRYLARGLNSCSGTGNEVECEQLVWVPKKAGQSVPFSRYIWRRGTIPIWWGAELKKITSAEAEIHVADHQPYKGTTQYYQRLSRRYDARNSNPHNKNDLVPIVCINLLRNGEGKSESLLVHHFEKSLNHLITTENLPYTKIELMNYDWHANNKAIGEIHTIEGLWKLVKESTIAVGISEGDYLVSRQRTKNCSGEIIQSDEYEGAFCLRTSQNGALRYNCADSLDRTNAASFFGAVQVFVEQCRRLMIPLDNDLFSGYELLEHATCSAPLPPGWERRSDAGTGKSFYIDHNTRITTWHHPCPDKPWKRFDLTFEEFKRSTMLLPVAQLSELFLLAGDIHATLYTGSKAMHSQILSIFNDERGKFKQFSAAQSMKITLQRRYKNVVVDSSRQKQLEIFLGMRLFKHLPSVPFRPLHVLSRQPACFLKPVPGIQGSGDDISLLSFKEKSLIWVCPEAADVIELFIYLSEPCHVCELLLTVSHGADDSTSPATVDVRTGRDLDGLKLVLECGSIPHCANGTKISIPLSGRRRHGPDSSRLSLLYDFDELEGEFDFLTRVVALTFYPAVSGRAPVTLGEVEVLGASIPWRSVFMQEETVSSLLEQAKRQNKSNPFMQDLDGLNSSQCGIMEYTKFIKSFMGSETRKKIDFVEAMKLEIERLHLNLSAAERDKALLSIEIDPSSINPNLLIDETYMIKLCRVASSLAFLGQTSMEDKIIGSIGPETSNDNNTIDFWNVVGLRESCRGGKCRVQAETQGSPQSVGSTLFNFCHHCGRQVCEACCAGKGALLITTSHNLRRFNTGLSHGNQHLTAEEIICKQCCSDVVLHALVLDYVRVLLSSRRTSRMIMAMEQALDLVVGLRHVDRVVRGSETPDPRMLLNGEESLAEFPFASFLHSVDTAADVVHCYSLLLPLDFGPHDAYWKATTNTSSVDFTIVLGSLSDVSGVILVVSPCGYSESDAPSVKIWTSTKIREEERSFMGRWDVHSLLESSMELYGPENHGSKDDVPRHIRFSFTNPVRCRIIWITLSLDKDASLDEGDTHLHAKRLIVVGSSLRDNEIDLTLKESFNSNHLKLIKSLELPPRLSRFKVPIEGERSIDNDLVLEMYLSPTTLLAGFRLDAFSAIQPRVSHSPGFNALRDHSFSLLDQRHLNPAVLYLRVSILQEARHKMVSVAEYRLPGTKPGTAMYFDFPKELQTQRILFRLVGDVASFSDDPAEQDDAEFGISPVAVGLSLSSRIKLYYYADSYEVGKWAAAV